MAGSPLDPAVVVVIVGMAVVTYATKAGGLWLLGRVDVPERLESGLAVLPGAVVVAIVGPELLDGGPLEWAAASVVLLVMWRTGSVLAAVVAGVGAVLALRGVA